MAPTPQTTFHHDISTNEHFDPKPVLKTLYEQLGKTSPDGRSLVERIMEKSISLGGRLNTK